MNNIFAGGGAFGARSAFFSARASMGQAPRRPILATLHSAVISVQNAQKRAFDLYDRNEALPPELRVPRAKWRIVGDAGDSLNIALVVPYNEQPDAPKWTDPPPPQTVDAVANYEALVADFEKAVTAAEAKTKAAAPMPMPMPAAPAAPAGPPGAEPTVPMPVDPKGLLLGLIAIAAFGAAAFWE